MCVALSPKAIVSPPLEAVNPFHELEHRLRRENGFDGPDNGTSPFRLLSQSDLPNSVFILQETLLERAAEIETLKKQCEVLESHNSSLRQQVQILEKNTSTLDQTVSLLTDDGNKKGLISHDLRAKLVQNRDHYFKSMSAIDKVLFFSGS